MNRNINELTWQEVAALDLSKDGAIVLPIGSIEQHGPHLSTDCDLVFSEKFLEMSLAQLAPEVKIWRLPMLPISKSNEHVGFPGTWSLSATTLMAVIKDIALSAKANGFRRIVLWNCHGGNRALLEVLARDIRIETGLMTFQIFASGATPDPLEPLDPREPDYGIHAGEWETSMMMAVSPDRVRENKRDCAFPDFQSETLALELTGATIGWVTSDFMTSGTWGDATAASLERGEARLGPLIERLTTVLAEIASFEIKQN
ncbi:creatininase family protein [Cognatishimia activa]|uniref:Creatinine amidohydrolase n=1 Tax=Cognatishimia activa TaxID=1715691 RepID=A0A0P1J1X3_9RHOB|nr:creatininase family protein [Cognatishimia activa]CUJ37193.1 Creatinine amidohydrolase [Cognatishimia activa]CUK26975.1 Creatinine amidohydrolase [Cognatishimia activa]